MATRRNFLLGIGAVGLTASACVGPRGRGPGASSISPEGSARGIELKQAGQFQDAIPYFAQVAGLGAGYEVAQYHLGDCLVRLGDAESEPESAGQKHREGVVWIRLAAESGYVNAQARLAELLHQGRGVTADNSDAAMYLLLAERNVRSIFMHDARQDELGKLRAALSEEELGEGARRAAMFVKLEQSQRSLPVLPRAGRSSGRGARPSGGRPGGGRGGGRAVDK